MMDDMDIMDAMDGGDGGDGGAIEKRSGMASRGVWLALALKAARAAVAVFLFIPLCARALVCPPDIYEGAPYFDSASSTTQNALGENQPPQVHTLHSAGDADWGYVYDSNQGMALVLTHYNIPENVLLLIHVYNHGLENPPLRAPLNIKGMWQSSSDDVSISWTGTRRSVYFRIRACSSNAGPETCSDPNQDCHCLAELNEPLEYQVQFVNTTASKRMAVRQAGPGLLSVPIAVDDIQEELDEIAEIKIFRYVVPPGQIASAPIEISIPSPFMQPCECPVWAGEGITNCLEYRDVILPIPENSVHCDYVLKAFYQGGEIVEFSRISGALRIGFSSPEETPFCAPPSATPSATATLTPTSTATAASTTAPPTTAPPTTDPPATTISPTLTPSPSATDSITPVISITPSLSATPQLTPSPTISPSPALSPSPPPSPIPLPDKAHTALAAILGRSTAGAEEAELNHDGLLDAADLIEALRQAQ